MTGSLGSKEYWYSYTVHCAHQKQHTGCHQNFGVTNVWPLRFIFLAQHKWPLRFIGLAQDMAPPVYRSCAPLIYANSRQCAMKSAQEMSFFFANYTVQCRVKTKLIYANPRSILRNSHIAAVSGVHGGSRRVPFLNNSNKFNISIFPRRRIQIRRTFSK